MTGYRSIALLYALCFAPACTAGLFDNQEQQAGKLFKQDKFEDAAENFTDSYRRGVAQYRAGQYGQAAESFDQVQRESVKTDALYNLGNSRFQEGKLESAAEAYREVLLREPDYEDARHNLGLTSAMLAETSAEEKLDPRDEDEREQQHEEEQKEQQEQSQDDKQSEKEQSSEDQEQKDEQEKQEQQQSGDEQKEQQDSSGDQEQQEQESSSGKQSDEQQQSGDEQSEQQDSSGDQEQQEQESSSGKQSDEQQQSGDEQSEQQDSSGDQEQQEQESSSGKQSDEQQQSGDEQSEQQDSSGDQEQQEQQSSASKEPGQQQDGEDGEFEKHGATGGERADQQADSSEQAIEDGQSGGQQTGREGYEQVPDQSGIGDGTDTGDSSGNERLDDAEAATADSGDKDQETGGDAAGLRQQAGVANDPRDFDPARANMNMGAIEQFDQLGRQIDSESEDAVLPGEIPDASSHSTVTLMDQLLDQVEGDPVNLMRNQFRLEEQRMNRTGGRLYEPRPW